MDKDYKWGIAASHMHVHMRTLFLIDSEYHETNIPQLLNIIHKLPDANHIRCQFETAFQLVLQSRQSPGINIQ